LSLLIDETKISLDWLRSSRKHHSDSLKQAVESEQKQSSNQSTGTCAEYIFDVLWKH